MSKLKNILLAGLSMVLVAALSIAGTVAYLQDEDSAVNVMTLGNVTIEQIELQRAEGVAYNAGEAGKGNGVKEGDLVPFVQGQPLYPAVPQNNASTDYSAEANDLFYWGDYVYSGTAGNGLWNDDKISNVMDKFVFVKNTGKSEAYFRTLIAFECPEGMEFSQGSDKELMMNVNSSALYDWDEIGYIVVKEVRYLVMEATYLNPLAPGNTAHPSLLQVLLTHNATNEDMELLGGTYEILVLSQAVQAAGFPDANTALDTGFGASTVVTTAEWFDGVLPDKWDGTADTSWYNDTDTEFTLTSAEQLAGLAELVNTGTNFEGKTVKLDTNVDLSGQNFTPIGGFDKENAYFAGTFDGDNHTISGLTESGWDLGYEYGQTAGMGLFGVVYNATIKDVNIDNAEISMEAVVMGVIAGYANGDCTFEGINVTNTQIANYNWDTGGIVGQVYGSDCTFTFKDIVIDESTTISGHWGTWDVSAGGVIGRTANGVNVVMEDVTVAATLDVYNDVCAAYQWYAYRYSGMLVGYTKTTEKVDGRTVATAPHVTCKNVTVIYDDWANYTYCQASNVAPQYVRVQGGYSTDPYYSGRHWTAGVDAEGNKMVDDNHVHADGEAHNELIVFDQLFGGGQGVYGTATHEGVTVIYNNK